MKNQSQVVYCLKCNGTTAIYLTIEDLFESIKMEFEGDPEIEFTISQKQMTEKEINNLPEFDGF